MPELPEVETTCRGIAPHLLNQEILKASIHNAQLRWPVPNSLPKRIRNQKVISVNRRAKYILIRLDKGTLIIHLGMSGSLRVTDSETPRRKHDHFSLDLNNGKQLRLHDPRRFGAVLWTTGEVLEHPLLESLGPEPLSDAFNTSYLAASCKGRSTSIKQHIMNGKIVVGVGNIYASEALFIAGINPKRQAARISNKRLADLVEAIKSVLDASIKQGGTTLRDFVREDGAPGYFKLHLNVYGRAGEPCYHCGNEVRQITLGQRSTFYCSTCQR